MKKTIKNSYLILGSGRLGRHLQHYFNLLKLPFSSWSRSAFPDAFATLPELLSNHSHVLLAISDGALGDFYETYLKNRPDLTIVHFSGAFQHSGMTSCHPMMTFSDELYSLEIYERIHFAVTGPQNLQQVLPELPNPSFRLENRNKALYHAWCVLSAAGTQTLWNKALNEFSSFGVPPEAFEVYIQQITRNFLHSPEKSRTGPWVRQDQVTIQENLKALGPTPAGEVYEILMKGLS